MEEEGVKERGLETERVFLEVVKVLNEEPRLDRDAQEKVLRKISFIVRDFAPPSDREERLYAMCQNLSFQLERSVRRKKRPSNGYSWTDCRSDS